MSVCVLSDSQNNNEKSALTNIEKAVKDNNAGALQNILQEVNESRLTETKFCTNVKTLDSKLSPEAKDATNVKEIPNVFENGPSKAFLEMEPLWTAAHTQRHDR